MRSLLLALGAIFVCAVSAQRHYLYNEVIKAGFHHSGLDSLEDFETEALFNVDDAWQIKVTRAGSNNQNITRSLVPSHETCNLVEFGGDLRSYFYQWDCVDQLNVTLVYELPAAARFLTKRLRVHSPTPFYLEEISLWKTNVTTPHPSVFHGWMPAKNPNRWNEHADIVGFARWPKVSVFFAVTNPFNELHARKGYWSDFRSSMLILESTYSPGMWQDDQSLEETHEADMGIVGFATRGKYSYSTGVNAGEQAAFKKSADGIFLDSEMRNKTMKVHVAWAENDYQIDVGTAEGRWEYKQILKRAAQLGLDYVVYEPRNTNHLTEFNATDGWGLERTWWFSLGEKMRAGLWSPVRDRVPDDVMDMIEYARERCGGIRLLAYVYPCMPFEDLRAFWTGADTRMLDLGKPVAAGWLLEQLIAFMLNSGAGGFAWDYDIFSGSSSQAYSQWYSWMWILRKLRAQFPHIVLHHRQHHGYGPWYQFAGSYAVPLQSDGNPESYGVRIPSLHPDHIAADQLRRVNHVYATEQLMPASRIPGFMFHQSERRDNESGDVLCNAMETNKCYNWNVRDFDYTGYKYSVLSSVATAGLNNILYFLPARDSNEMSVDISFVKRWLEWTDEHIDFLQHAAPIPTLPYSAWGEVDGWHAMKDNAGFIFLFNPNFKQLEVTLTFDESIGIVNASLDEFDRWMVVEHYPNNRSGALGPWKSGDDWKIKVGGSDALVLELQKGSAGDPSLWPSIGFGPTGTWKLVPLNVNGIHDLNCSGLEDSTTDVWVKFNGTKMHHAMSISADVVPTDFQGGWFNTTFSIPAGIQAQLEARTRTLQTLWTDRDNDTSWLNPSRLLMTIFYDQPEETNAPWLYVDGQRVHLKKAYNSRDAPRQACVDDPNWVDNQYGGGNASCHSGHSGGVADNPSWCTDFGDYSREARRACPFSCGVCSPHEVSQANLFMGWYYDATNLSVDVHHQAALWMHQMQPPVDTSRRAGVVYPGENIYPCGQLGCKMPVDATSDDCETLCARYSRCAAYSWDPKGCDHYTNQDHNTCWLKGRVYRETSAKPCIISKVIRQDSKLNRFQGLFWENVETEYTDELVECIGHKPLHTPPSSFLGVDAKGTLSEPHVARRREHSRLVRVHSHR